MSKVQSAYRRFHSCETALPRFQNDIFVLLDAGRSIVLLLLNLSAAFDTIDHNILIHRLQYWFGFLSAAFKFLASFLSVRSQTVVTSKLKSQSNVLEYGAPQGSVFGPLFYSLFTTLLFSVISNHPGI